MQNRRKAGYKSNGLFRRWNRVMGELKISTAVTVMAFWCSWWLLVEFFPRLIYKGDLDSQWDEMYVTWYPTVIPKLLCSKSSCRYPQPALAGRRLLFPGLQSLVPLFVVPLCFCWGVGLLSCQVKPSGDILVFIVLSWRCPGISPCTLLLYTPIYN